MAIIDAMKKLKSNRRRQALAALTLIAGAPAAFADNLLWTAGDGAWENGANWLGGQAPGAGDFAVLEKTPIPTITSTGADNIALELKTSNKVNVTAGKLTVLGTIQTQNSGSLSVLGGAHVDAGRISHEAGREAFLISGIGSAVSVSQGVFNSGAMLVRSNATLDAESIDNFASVPLDFASLRIDGGAHVTANSMINHGRDLANGLSAGDVIVDGAGSALTIHGALTNEALIGVSDHAVLDTHSIDMTEAASLGVTSGGKITTQSVINHGFVQVHSGGSPATEGASLEVSDLFTNHGTLQVMVATTASIAGLDNRALVTVEGGKLSGQQLKNSGDGKLVLTDGATVSFDAALSASRFGITIDGVDASMQTGKFQQQAGTTFVNGGTLGASSAFGVQIVGGELTGHGNIDGRLVMDGEGALNAGDANDATQRFDIAAGLALLGGSFAVDLGGTADSDHDLLDVTGAATLGGTLRVALESGYVPILGDAFDIILADSITGAFGNILLPTLGNGLKFTTMNGGSFFRLEVAAVPLPAPALLLSGALGVLGYTARRRASL